jgi:hypothetical protein
MNTFLKNQPHLMLGTKDMLILSVKWEVWAICVSHPPLVNINRPHYVWANSDWFSVFLRIQLKQKQMDDTCIFFWMHWTTAFVSLHVLQKLPGKWLSNAARSVA